MDPGTLRNSRGGSSPLPHAARFGKERRRTPRYPIDAAIRVDDETALAIDLSRSGVFFESERPFEIGDWIDVVFPFEHTGRGASLRCAALVVRVEPRGDYFGVAVAYEPITCTLSA